MSKLRSLSVVCAALMSHAAYAVPDFIDEKTVENAEFSCINAPVKYSAAEQKHIDVLWQETLKYVEGYAVALTSSDSEQCQSSALAMTETNRPGLTGPTYQCIMDNRDMQVMVKHIYAVLNNPDKAKQCFSAKKDSTSLLSPSETMTQGSAVARWINRPEMKDYFANLSDKALNKAGIEFADNFAEMITGSDIQMPANFPFDISANALPNLWASVGWAPMYSKEDHRSLTAGESAFRAGYAYAEVMGKWGLLQIDKINGEEVGAEIGMTVQRMDSFYPYHFHIAQEIYHTIREPACLNSTKQLILKENNPALKVLERTSEYTKLNYNGQDIKDIDHYFVSTTTEKDPLIYIPTNSIHAFDLKEHCEAEPKKSAHVAIWARSVTPNYGGTTLCELQDKSLDKSNINNKNANVDCKPVKYKF
ncbi:hypothetical protein [Shewanella fidelis]|uniref:hypothetical protein n=1 Tax=Shewanella fidelis TaxID=173509 RepID=UPI0004B5D7B1|nr:hypothetical protein [Shewanella fidelis]